MASAAVLPEATRNLAAHQIELLFDLDTVLSGADDCNCFPITPSGTLVADFPAVAADICAVCMEDFRPDEIGKQIPCGHVYHEPCIASWLSFADCCPLCRCLVAGDRPESCSSAVRR